MADIACVGIMVADVIVKSVDTIPKKGLLERVDSIGLFSGGNAMTAAINIKKIGISSAVIGKVGTDYFGKFLIDCLDNSGVETDGVSISTDTQTSVSVALSSHDGERTFLHCTGANGALCYDDINWDTIDKAKIVFVTGTYLMDAFDGVQTSAFLKKCKEMGKITALDVCWDAKGRWDDILKDTMPYIDIFMPSIDEAKEIAHKDTPEQIAQVFFDWGVKTAVIKLGSKGCYVQNKGESGKRFPSLGNVDVVDTTGAGDSFCSGFLSALAMGKDIFECAEFGNATGAMCVTQQGATTGIKNKTEILKFIEKHR